MCNTIRVFLFDARDAAWEIWLPLAKSLPPRRAALLTKKNTPEREREIVLGFALYRYASAACGLPRDDRDWRILDGGKPVTDDGAPYFSLAHAHGVFALALSNSVKVGVDIEPIRPHAAALARKLGLPNDSDEKSVLCRWCALEAAAKRSGAGLCDILQKTAKPDAAVRTVDVGGTPHVLALSPDAEFSVTAVKLADLLKNP